jgi:autotransporter translocation and assembly factor TamB
VVLRVLRISGLLVVLLIVVVLGLLASAPGHDLVRKLVVKAMAGAVDGRVEIRSLGGPLWRRADINGLVLADTAGQPVIQAERLSVSYNIIDLLRGQYRLSSVTLVEPLIDLDQGPDGKLNVEHLFRGSSSKDTTHTRRPLIVLHDVAIVAGTVRLRTHPKGKEAELTQVDHLTADFSRLRLSHPDSVALEADVKRLAGDLNNPRLHLQRLDGKFSLSGDTLRVDVDHVTLPGTRAAIAGQFRLGGPRLALDLAVNASPVTFSDVRSIVDILPDSGGGEVAAMVHLSADGTVEADIRHADVHTGRSVIRGKGIVLIRRDQTGTARNIDVELQPLDLALLDRFVSDLPVRGLVRGAFKGGGRLSDMTFVSTLDWTDEKTEGHPVNNLDVAGRLVMGGKSGVDFRAFVLRRADADFASIRQFAPSIKLAGRLRATGILEGPWRSAQFNGTLLHYADSNQASQLRGAVMLGLGDTTRIDAVVDIDSLSLDLLRRTYPAIPLTGQLQGHAGIHGPIDSLDADLALAGPAGRLTAKGMIGLRDSAAVLRLSGTFDSLDLHGLRDYNPVSTLGGAWRVDIVSPSDSTRASTGTIGLDLSGVTAGGVALGPGTFAISLRPDRIQVDQAKLAFNGGGLEASGAIGRAKGSSGTLNFAIHADTIGYIEPLVRWLSNSGDSGIVKLDGKGAINGSMVGNLAAWTLTADASVDGVNVAGDFGRTIEVQGTLASDSAGTLRVAGRMTADSIAVGSLGYRPVTLAVEGRFDSLTAGAEVGFGKSKLRTRVTTWSDSTRRTIRLDTLAFELPAHSWQLTAPATIRAGNGRVTMDSIDFRSGTAFLRAHGTLARSGAADFILDADSVPLEDIYGILQQDTTGIKGAVSADARITGDAHAPAMVMSVELEDGRIGDYNLPRVFVQGDYHEKLLTLSGGLWRDSVRIVSLHGTAPLDLSLSSVEQRELPGPIDITAQADTLDMRVFNALTSTITGVSGTMALNVHALGTWAAPNLSGFVDIKDGAVRVPSIGANYDSVDLRLEAPGDSTLRVVRGRLRAGGTLDLDGRLSFNRGLTHPDVSMRLDMAGFNAFNISGFGSLVATGKDTLSGPLFGATLTGSLVADKGALQFANLVEKRIVSLDDPEFRAMVDSNLAGADLAPSGNTIFFDSLRIANLSVTMGPDVWLRSTEANIQLDGNIVVSRSFEDNIPRYRIDGTLRALRGDYKLALGNGAVAVTRDFRVTKGEVRFFGTPDFNPEMNVTAEYVARSDQGSPLTVRANIEGTLLYPRLRLTSDAQPPLTETEIASYLVFGRAGAPDLGVGGVTSQLGVIGGSFLSGAGQALVNQLGLPINYLTITPGTGRATSNGGTSSARIEAGAQINERTFLTLNAGLCEVLTSKLVGVTLEYRLSSIWSATAAFEPVIQQCGTVATLANLKTLYQLGFDLFWQSGGR